MCNDKVEELEPLQTINISIYGVETDFNQAKEQANLSAANRLQEPQLIAWYDDINQKAYPEIPECQQKTGWITYATEHGGKLRVNVNNKTFCFVYADTANSRENT